MLAARKRDAPAAPARSVSEPMNSGDAEEPADLVEKDRQARILLERDMIFARQRDEACAGDTCCKLPA